MSLEKLAKCFVGGASLGSSVEAINLMTGKLQEVFGKDKAAEERLKEAIREEISNAKEALEESRDCMDEQKRLRVLGYLNHIEADLNAGQYSWIPDMVVKIYEELGIA